MQDWTHAAVIFHISLVRKLNRVCKSAQYCAARRCMVCALLYTQTTPQIAQNERSLHQVLSFLWVCISCLDCCVYLTTCWPHAATYTMLTGYVYDVVCPA